MFNFQPQIPSINRLGMKSTRRGKLQVVEMQYCHDAPRGCAHRDCTAHKGGCATSQLDLPSLPPLSVAGCGRLQLGVPHWATSVEYCK